MKNAARDEPITRGPNRMPGLKTTRIVVTPEISAACQMLYSFADQAPTYLSQMMCLRAIHHLTGKPLTQIVRTWEATR